MATIADLVPFEPNISKLAAKLGIGRTTVSNYLLHLQEAKILNFLSQQDRGIAGLQKPDKIYLENTNLSFALKEYPDAGNLRETFVLNQLLNKNHQVCLPKKGDLLIDGRYVIEVGGKGKTYKQIKNVEYSYLAKDDIELGFGRSLPLWLFGFLY